VIGYYPFNENKSGIIHGGLFFRCAYKDKQVMLISPWLIFFFDASGKV